MNALIVAAALTVWSVVCFFAGYGLAAWRETWAPVKRRGGYVQVTNASSWSLNTRPPATGVMPIGRERLRP